MAAAATATAKAQQAIETAATAVQGNTKYKLANLIYEGSINFDLGSTDFGSFWGAILGSFWALLEAKMRHVRSTTRLGSVSRSKT